MGLDEFAIETTERRPGVSGDEAARVQSASVVEAALLKHQPDERLDAGHQHRALYGGIAIFEGDG